MKINPSPLIASLIAAAAAVSLLHADPGGAPQGEAAASPEAAAKQKVSEEIFAKVSSREGWFSRAAPMPRERLEYQTPIILEGETRLPFAIIALQDEQHPLWQGYVRLEDQQIFLRDPTTGKFRLASSFPRFATAPAVAEE